MGCSVVSGGESAVFISFILLDSCEMLQSRPLIQAEQNVNWIPDIPVVMERASEPGSVGKLPRISDQLGDSVEDISPLQTSSCTYME